MTYSLVDQATHGTVSIDPGGSYHYVPDQYYNGTDTFTFSIFDGFFVSNTATVTIDIASVNNHPILADTSFTLDEDTTYSGTLPVAFDPDGDPQTYLYDNDAQHGTVVINPNGTFTYTPNANFNGTDTFHYHSNDGVSGTDTSATATVTIDPVDEPQLFTTDADTVDLNAFDLSLYTVAEATDALAGDDHVTLSETENVGVLFEGGAGQDTITGSTNADLVSGGADADEVHLGAGNDTFDVSAADLALGEIIDGGADDDTLRIDGGGTVDLTGVTLTSIEDIQLTDLAGTTLTVADAATGRADHDAVGANDIVKIASGGAAPTPAEVADLILANGVERVEWSLPGFASEVTATPDTMTGGFTIEYLDNEELQDHGEITQFYNADGDLTRQVNVYNSALYDGIVRDHTFDPATGLITQMVMSDLGGARNFSLVTTTFANGKKSHTDALWDNRTDLDTSDDTRTEEWFDANGVITLRTTTDTGNSKEWTSYDTEYVGGVAQIWRWQWDAGVRDGGQTVNGEAGAQILSGAATNDVLRGGAGDDTFLFVDGFGMDRIADFTKGEDLLDLTGYGAGIDTLAELQAAATLSDTAAGLVVDFGNGDQITLKNIVALDNGDFVVAVPV